MERTEHDLAQAGPEEWRQRREWAQSVASILAFVTEHTRQHVQQIVADREALTLQQTPAQKILADVVLSQAELDGALGDQTDEDWDRCPKARRGPWTKCWSTWRWRMGGPYRGVRRCSKARIPPTHAHRIPSGILARAANSAGRTGGESTSRVEAAPFPGRRGQPPHSPQRISGFASPLRRDHCRTEGMNPLNGWAPLWPSPSWPSWAQHRRRAIAPRGRVG
jgi:hypothetical protein